MALATLGKLHMHAEHMQQHAQETRGLSTQWLSCAASALVGMYRLAFGMPTKILGRRRKRVADERAVMAAESSLPCCSAAYVMHHVLEASTCDAAAPTLCHRKPRNRSKGRSRRGRWRRRCRWVQGGALLPFGQKGRVFKTNGNGGRGQLGLPEPPPCPPFPRLPCVPRRARA